MKQMKTEKTLQQMLSDYKNEVESALDRAVSLSDCRQKEVIEAMRYSLLGGGKRLRAVLVLEFARLGEIDPVLAMPAACAIEMIHAYSLIHDDLPCMDDDDMRRGKPSCHICYGEATALLAGDGLLTAAFQTLAKAAQSLPAQRVLDCVSVLSEAAGYQGMIGGQVIDLAGIDKESMEEMYRMKTGALLRASCVMGCLLAGRRDLVEAAEQYAENLGLAFQIVDDILDVTGDPALLGKPVGSDADNEKKTSVTLYSMEKAKEMADRYTAEARCRLEQLGADGFLQELTDSLLNRLQ